MPLGDPISATPPSGADHRTRTYSLVRDSGAFALSILARDQEEPAAALAAVRLK